MCARCLGKPKKKKKKENFPSSSVSESRESRVERDLLKQFGEREREEEEEEKEEEEKEKRARARATKNDDEAPAASPAFLAIFAKVEEFEDARRKGNEKERRECEQTREGESFFLSLSLSLSLSLVKETDHPTPTRRRKGKVLGEREREGEGRISLSQNQTRIERTIRCGLSLSLLSSSPPFFIHCSLSLSLCVSKKSTNLSPRLDRIEKERERIPRHRIQKPRGDRNISPNFQISLSLSLSSSRRY